MKLQSRNPDKNKDLSERCSALGAMLKGCMLGARVTPKIPSPELDLRCFPIASVLKRQQKNKKFSLEEDNSILSVRHFYK